MSTCSSFPHGSGHAFNVWTFICIHIYMLKSSVLDASPGARKAHHMADVSCTCVKMAEPCSKELIVESPEESAIIETG